MKANNLRVVVIADAIQGRNGVGTYYMDLCQHLRSTTDYVELISPRLDTPHLCQGRSLPMPGDPTQNLYMPRLQVMEQHILKAKPDVIVLPGIGAFSAAGFFLAKKHRIKILFAHQTDYNNLLDLYYGPVSRYCFYPLVWLNAWFFKKSDAVIGINQETADQARDLSGKVTDIVATPLSSDFCDHPISTPGTVLKRIIFVGRLASEKRIDDLLALVAQRPDIQFTICGDGPLREEVQGAAQTCPNLNFMGWCSREVVRQQVDQSDLLILPSVVEAFGTVALEAMARARLVMTSPECGINDWPNLSKAIYIREADDSLAQALEKLEAIPGEQRQAMALQARELALDANRQAIDSWLRALYKTLLTPSLHKRSISFGLLRMLVRGVGLIRRSAWRTRAWLSPH